MPRSHLAKMRRGTRAQWVAANPVLAVGEPGYETDTGIFRVGNGVSAWTALPPTGGTTPTNHNNDFGPFDSFAWSWSYDPIHADAGHLAVNGTLYLIRLNVRELPTPFTDTLWGIHTVGAGPVAGQNWSGLYDSAGDRLVQAGIDGTLTTLGLRNVVFGATNLPTVPDHCWVALLFNAATPPTLLRAAAAAANMSNFGLLVFPSEARFATNGVGLTTLPVSINPANNVPIAASIWAAAG